MGEESSSYFNWTTLYRATNGYDYGVWRRTVFGQPQTLAASDPAMRALGLRYVDVRMMDKLMEGRCAGQAMIDRASVLRYSDGTVMPPLGEAPPREVTYAVPGTFGADIVGAVCARGRRLFSLRGVRARKRRKVEGGPLLDGFAALSSIWMRRRWTWTFKHQSVCCDLVSPSEDRPVKCWTRLTRIAVSKGSADLVERP